MSGASVGSVYTSPPVPPALRAYVVSRVAYDVDFGAAGVHRGLPSTALTFVLPLDERLRVGWLGTTEEHAAWSSLSGLHAAPAAIHHTGSQRGIQLALTVAGARALLGRPAADLAGALSDLDEALPELADLPARLHDATTWPERLALVDRVLLGRLGAHDAQQARSEVGQALAALTRGTAVEAVADEVGYSRRRLSTLVRAESGLTPTDYRRVARFQRTCGLLGRRPLAEVAAACGYADQAHLTREWTALAGCPPTTWLREEFPFVQDDGRAAEQAGSHD